MRTKVEILREKLADSRKERHQAVLRDKQMAAEFRLVWFTYPDQRDRLRESWPVLAKELDALGWV